MNNIQETDACTRLVKTYSEVDARLYTGNIMKRLNWGPIKFDFSR